MPEYVPEEAKDLIKKLLILDPLQRLGGGHDNSDNKIDKLKQHPFFNGIDWETLPNQQPPDISKPLIKSAESTPKSGKVD